MGSRETLLAAILEFTVKYFLHDKNHDLESATALGKKHHRYFMERLDLRELRIYYFAAYTPFAYDWIMGLNLYAKWNAAANPTSTVYLKSLPYNRQSLVDIKNSNPDRFSKPSQARATYALAAQLELEPIPEIVEWMKVLDITPGAAKFVHAGQTITTVEKRAAGDLKESRCERNRLRYFTGLYFRGEKYSIGKLYDPSLGGTLPQGEEWQMIEASETSGAAATSNPATGTNVGVCSKNGLVRIISAAELFALFPTLLSQSQVHYTSNPNVHVPIIIIHSAPPVSAKPGELLEAELPKMVLGSLLEFVKDPVVVSVFNNSTKSGGCFTDGLDVGTNILVTDAHDKPKEYNVKYDESVHLVEAHLGEYVFASVPSSVPFCMVTLNSALPIRYLHKLEGSGGPLAIFRRATRESGGAFIHKGKVFLVAPAFDAVGVYTFKQMHKRVAQLAVKAHGMLTLALREKALEKVLRELGELEDYAGQEARIMELVLEARDELLGESRAPWVDDVFRTSRHYSVSSSFCISSSD